MADQNEWKPTALREVNQTDSLTVVDSCRENGNAQHHLVVVLHWINNTTRLKTTRFKHCKIQLETRILIDQGAFP